MPKLAAFPKAYMHALCKDGSMTISEWITLAATAIRKKVPESLCCGSKTTRHPHPGTR